MYKKQTRFSIIKITCIPESAYQISTYIRKIVSALSEGYNTCFKRRQRYFVNLVRNTRHGPLTVPSTYWLLIDNHRFFVHVPRY